jgi:cell pole-organizing protein PopZ
MAFMPKFPKIGLPNEEYHDESSEDSQEVREEEYVQEGEILEDKAQEREQIDAFEALRHSFRPKDDFSEKMQVLVKNMAEPMIRNWLEKNMMGIVEDLVRSEIERVTRGTHS